MTSFLVCHKEVNRFSPSRNPAEEAPLAGLKEEGCLLPRPGSTRTKPSRLGLAQRGGLVRRGWLSVFSMLAIGFVWLAPPLRAQFAYVANSGDNTVSAYSIGANGALTPVPGSPFAAGSEPVSVAVDPTGKFAYVANPSGNNVSAYSIGCQRGPDAGPRFALRSGDRALLSGRGSNGQVRLRGKRGSNNVSAYSIGANGALTPVPGSPFAAGTSPVSVAVDPTGKFAYVANVGSGNVSAYSIGCRRLPDAALRVALRSGEQSRTQWPWIQRASSPTWQTRAATTSRPTASVPTGP